MKIAFLFPGQGTQTVGMGSNFLSNDSYKEVFNKLPKELQTLTLEGPAEELNKTQNAQPCIVTVSLAIANILKNYGIEADYVAGLSLGEYSALAYSQVLTLEETLELVAKRGAIMEEALENSDTGMLAVLNSDEDTLKKIIVEYENVEIANYNSPKQIVLTGSNKSLDLLFEKLKEEKIRCVKLNVSGAFHSSYLKNASEKLYEELSNYTFKTPNKKIVYNTLGSTTNDDTKILLKQQICSSVKFKQSLEFLKEQGVDTFIELGPGKVLSGLVKQTLKDVQIYNIDSLEAIESVVKIINE